MRKLLILAISSAILMSTIFAADMVDLVEDNALNFNAAQHTLMIQPSGTEDVWQNFGITPNDLGSIFLTRVFVGPDELPLQNDVRRNMSFETEGKMKLEFTGIVNGVGYVSEVIELNNERKELQKCYDYVVSVEVLELQDAALLNMRRGGKFGLDLPIAGPVVGAMEHHLLQGGQVEKTLYHNADDVEVSTWGCFSVDNFFPNGSNVLELTYYATLN